MRISFVVKLCRLVRYRRLKLGMREDLEQGEYYIFFGWRGIVSSIKTNIITFLLSEGSLGPGVYNRCQIFCIYR